MDEPVVIKNVLPVTLLQSIQDNMKYSGWLMNNESYDGDSMSWGLDRYHRNDNSSWFNAAVTIKLKCQRYIKHNCKLQRIHVNGQTRGQFSSFHTDSESDFSWTFVLFSELSWDTQWGGEFVCKNPKSESDYQYFPYIPNSGVLIPSKWEHYGQSPNQSTDALRTTVAFIFQECNYLMKCIENNTDDKRTRAFF